MKRVCIYLVREPDKRHIGYILHALSAWEKAGVPVEVLCAGKAPKELEAAKPRSVRLETGFAAVLEEHAAADELIVMDDRLMGPLSPVEELLKKADHFDGDLWIMARRAPLVGLRGKAKTSVPLLTALTKGELSLERVCKSQRLTMGVLYDAAAMETLTADPLLDEPLRAVRELGCPFFLHELFHRDYDEVIIRTLGHQAQLFYQWLMKSHPQIIPPLWDYLLANHSQEDLFFNMKLSYILPTRGCRTDAVEEHLKTHPLALVMHLHYEDKIHEALAYASRFPAATHVYVTTNTERKRDLIQETLGKLNVAHLEVRVIQNRGRDVSSRLVGVRDIYDQHDYVCYFHDKKTLQTKPGSIGAGFAYKCEENMFGTRDYVYNIISLFAQNERLGMVSPPAPHHGSYSFTLGTNWGPNYKLTKAAYDKLGFHVPISEDKMPIAPLGSCFWFRTKAMQPMLSYPWSYDDFPPEPLREDGTILHALERIPPYACAEAGYYPAYVLTDRYAGLEYSSLRYYVRGYNQICAKRGMISYHRSMREEIARRL
ncbi:MAG: hypothetical protein J1E43_12105 [Christensenellaceae bacterium]|nr:hypothetical protein [Christensenellaceae bacterium]